MGLPVLLYHHVGPARAGTHPSLTVSPQRFNAHVDWLVRHDFRTLTVAETVDWFRYRYPLPRRTVLLTFDDGYGDLADHAFPALRAAGLSALVFIVTGLNASTNEWDQTAVGRYRLSH